MRGKLRVITINNSERVRTWMVFIANTCIRRNVQEDSPKSTIYNSYTTFVKNQ